MSDKKEEIKSDEPKLPDAAKAIIDAVKDQMKSEPAKTPVDSQPKEDPAKKYQEWRETKKKTMGWNEDQLNSYEHDVRSSQAPLIKDNALLKLRGAQKDFDKLETAYMSEVERYEKAGRVIDSALAEELFYMVKGKEISAGRYKTEAVDSQPKREEDRSSREVRRIAPAYNPSDAGSGAADKHKSEASSQLSDEEKDYLDFMDRAAAQIGMEVSAEDYVKGKEDKKRGRREISEQAIRRMEIPASAGAADRDLASLWNRSPSARRR